MIVVIPAYEPDEKLKKVVDGLINGTDYPIIIVDDGSGEAAQPVFDYVSQYAHVIKHEVNRGKGAAMKTAFEYIRSSGLFDENDGVITVDADGQHLTEDIVRVSKAWQAEPDALVLGGRRFTGNVPLRSRLGNGITRFVFAVTTGVRVHDTQTGLRAFAVSAIDEMLAIGGDRYEYEINQLLYCTKTHRKITEVTIETVYLNNNESSHFNTVKDSWRIYKTIFSFMGASVISWIVDYVLLLLLTWIISKLTGGVGIRLFGKMLEPKLPALVIARVCSSIVNYTLNRRVVFKSGNKLTVPLYFALVVLMLAFNYLLITVMTGAGLPLWLAQIFAQLIIYPISFVLQRKFVFNEKK